MPTYGVGQMQRPRLTSHKYLRSKASLTPGFELHSSFQMQFGLGNTAMELVGDLEEWRGYYL